MSVFEVDTKGTCLLCLNPNSTVVTINDCGDGELSQSAVAFNMLLRYLNVDIMKMTSCLSSVKSSTSTFNGVNLSVSLCGDCSSVSKDFLELFQTLEGIRLQMNVCFSQLFQFMEKGAKDRNRIGEFEKRIQTRSFEDLVGVRFAEGLRKETMEKVVQKLKSGVPQISLQKLSSKLVDVNDQTVGNSIKVRPKMGALSRNTNIRTGSKKVSTDKFGSQMSELKAAPPARISVNAKASDESKMDGSEGEYKSSIQPSSQVRERKKIRRNSTTALGNKLTRSKNGVDCEICGQYVSQKCNLLRHQLQRHTMAVLKDRLPSFISEETLETHLNVIIAKSKIVSKYKRRYVRECYFCNIREGCSLKVHLLKCHLDNIISEIEGTQQLPLLQTWEEKLRVRENLIIRGTHERDAGTMNESIPPENKKIKTSKSWSQMPEPSVESLESTTAYPKIFEEADDIMMGGKVPENTDKPLVQPPQVPKNKEAGAEAKSNSVSGNKLPRKPRRFKCEICGKYFIKPNLLRHQLQKHTMAVVKDRLPSFISEETLESSLNVIVAKSKIISKQKKPGSRLGGAVRECYFCNKQERYSLKVHLLKCHLEQIVSEHSHISHDKFTQQTLNKPSTSSSSLKYSCNSCEKVCFTLFTLKRHFANNHLAGHSAWKCKDCEKSFTRRNNLHSHRLDAHPISAYSLRIPAELSDQDFRTGLDEILGKSKKVACKNPLRSVWGCPLCGKHENAMRQMKLHIIRNHLDEIVENAETIRHAPAITDTDNYQFNPSTKVECILAGDDDDNGYACEFEMDPLAIESEMDPLAVKSEMDPLAVKSEMDPLAI